MSEYFQPSDPEKEEIRLLLLDEGKEIRHWSHYRFDSQMLTPTDGWSFTIGVDKLDPDTKAVLRPGGHVRLMINGNAQADGYIDSITAHASRSGGLEYTIEGRDRLGYVVDACADPTKTLKEGQTLLDALKQLFGPFGWSADDQFVATNQAARNVKSGVRGTPTTKGTKRFGKPIKSYVLHQLRPHYQEGVFAFASRIAQRHGLWIWLSPDGEKVIVSQPDFDQPGAYRIVRKFTGRNNVLEGQVRIDMAHQPTLIVADGFSGGGEFGKGRIKSIGVNPAVTTSDPDYAATFKRYPDARVVDITPLRKRYPVAKNRVLYLHDDESKTQEQLDNFVRRELSLLARHQLVAHYVVEGHGQDSGDGYIPWCTDMMVTVDDDVAGIHGDMYIAGRTLEKDRHGGTITRLELFVPHSIQF